MLPVWGKSTILKTISGILDPRRGTIQFKGQDITANDPAQIVSQGLSHVPEGREVFPLLSVRDNLMMGAYTRSDRDEVAHDLETVYRYFPILQERAALAAGPHAGSRAAPPGRPAAAPGPARKAAVTALYCPPPPATRAYPGLNRAGLNQSTRQARAGARPRG